MGEIKDKAERERLYAALLARDFRFDGKFFVAVATTGIYCRPVCPARPLERNCRFFEDSLSAERAGFRPCLRCRPEAAPLSPAWYGTSAIVGRAIRYIRDLGLAGLSSEDFAGKFGVGARHLRRLFVEEIGKTPRGLYEDLRLDLARSMLVETDIPVTEVALSSGYGSIRRFNAAFKDRFSRPPGAFRRLAAPKPGETATATAPRAPAVVLRLRYRPPYDWEGTLAFLARHATPGLEEVDAFSYTRHYPTAVGWGKVRVERDATGPALVVRFDSFDGAGLYPIVRRIRRVFDLDADPLLVSEALGRSTALRRLDEARPGIRVPGAWDPYETAVAIVLGQGVSTARATELVRRIVEVGAPFPEAAALARSDLAFLPTTRVRKDAIRAISAAVVEGSLSLHPHQDASAARRLLLALPGIGPWTAEYICMRCLSDPDAFPRRDLILSRIAASLGVEEGDRGIETTRPWRAYAAALMLREAMGADGGRETPRKDRT